VAGIALAICLVLGFVAAFTTKAAYFKNTDVAAPSPGEMLASEL
jgi:hypothetical protein